MRWCIPSPKPFGKLSRRPASTLVRFADRDPIDGMACVVGGDQKGHPIVFTVHDLFSKVNPIMIPPLFDVAATTDGLRISSALARR
jgi:hypothetical protein